MGFTLRACFLVVAMFASLNVRAATPTARVIKVLNEWVNADAVDHTSETLEDLWNCTAATHAQVKFYPDATRDLLYRLNAEFAQYPAREINFGKDDLNSSGKYIEIKSGGFKPRYERIQLGGNIKTVDDLYTAVRQSPPVGN